ncbi:YitT family protein [Treponema pectinovorum]|uniref:YitT family protein n=1 Tax=Treponema pectinovorum TaxID=164 RepID=UPI0011CB1082|nr:YitT family protein [Treponema pectinovorum]
MKKSFVRDFKRFLLVSLGGFLMALNIVVFVRAASLLPGGLSGIALLLQNIFSTYFGINIPFSVLVYALNVFPVWIGFKYIGKKFTLLSVVMIFISGIFTDLLDGFAWLHLTDDLLLCSVFGGILNSIAVVCCLFAESSSGGTDFIVIYVSEKTGKSAWNAIFFANSLILVIAGLLFGWDKALYSIILQYTTTQVTNALYKKYSKTTLLIITDKSDEIYSKIKELTNHGATVFEGRGEFSKKTRKMVYTVVSSGETRRLEKELRIVDPNSFINVIQSKDIIGQFYKRQPD